jgi:hypothetical protein
MSLPKKVQDTITSLLSPTAKSDVVLRRSVFECARTGARGVPVGARGGTGLADFLEKIAARPWTISDEDFYRLRGAGYSEDELLELTLAAAMGAGVRRFEAGLRALQAKDDERTT